MTNPDPQLGQPQMDAQVQAAQAADAQATADAQAEPAQTPSTSATKAEWVEYAVSQGMDRTEADSLTKDDLKSRYPV